MGIFMVLAAIINFAGKVGKLRIVPVDNHVF